MIRHATDSGTWIRVVTVATIVAFALLGNVAVQDAQAECIPFEESTDTPTESFDNEQIDQDRVTASAGDPASPSTCGSGGGPCADCNPFEGI